MFVSQIQGSHVIFTIPVLLGRDISNSNQNIRQLLTLSLSEIITIWAAILRDRRRVEETPLRELARFLSKLVEFNTPSYVAFTTVVTTIFIVSKTAKKVSKSNNKDWKNYAILFFCYIVGFIFLILFCSYQTRFTYDKCMYWTRYVQNMWKYLSSIPSNLLLQYLLQQ